MAQCLPTCAVPSCSSTPMFPIGSSGFGPSVYGGALGVLGSSSFSGRGTTSTDLGTLSGVIPQPISQLPPSEVMVQPAPVVMVMPGPILTSSCEPMLVGGSTGIGGLGSLSGGHLGSRLRRGSNCFSPC